MKKLLLLTYYFPPLGMGGTQRAAKLVKYLPEFGWQPMVMTVKEVAYYAYDHTLLQEVEGARIDRTGSLDPQRLGALLFKSKPGGENSKRRSDKKIRAANRLLAWMCVPDSKVLWLPFLIPRALRTMTTERIDCIFTTSPPHSVHLAGLVLKKITGRPWVADFRDGWCGGNFQVEPTPLHRRINHRLERWVVRSADKIVAVSRGLTQNLSLHDPDNPKKFSMITNGYDRADLAMLGHMTHDKAAFKVAFCGAITSNAPLTGFWQGLSQAVQAEPKLKSKMVVRLIGANLNPTLEQDIRQFGLQQMVHVTGYLDHLQALENMMVADLLLYPIAPWASSDFVPGKTFEYLASGKPVLVIGPAVEGVEILKQHAPVSVFSHDDTSGIAAFILDAYSRNRHVEQAHSSQPDHKYERRILTAKLARILDQVVGN